MSQSPPSDPPPPRPDSEALEEGRRVLRAEAAALAAAADRLDESFLAAVQRLMATQGRVVVTGIGKSGAVGRKGAATLASTGTPAFYLHPAEGVHGDLGMVTPRDLVIALSYSGETDEIVAILPVLKRIGVDILAVTGRPESTLAEASDLTLDVAVEGEACPLNLAPTTSTTVMLGILDALAVAAMHLRRFTKEQYALYHPAGSLGRRLLLRVGSLMRTGDRMATADPGTTVRDALFAITRAQSGTVFAVDPDGRFLGLLSDGDIRRLLLGTGDALESPLGDVINRSPRTTTPDRLVAEALELMERAPPCAELPVLDGDGRPVGVLNLKDIARTGIF